MDVFYLIMASTIWFVMKIGHVDSLSARVHGSCIIVYDIIPASTIKAMVKIGSLALWFSLSAGVHGSCIIVYYHILASTIWAVNL